MMKKCKFLLASLCFAFVCVFTLGLVTLTAPNAKAEGESYATATSYDVLDVKGTFESKKYTNMWNNDGIAWKLPETNNVEFTFKATATVNKDHAYMDFGFFTKEGDGFKSTGYWLFCDWGAKLYTVSPYETGTEVAKTNTTLYCNNVGDTLTFRVGVVKYYNAESVWSGNYFYVYVNGNKFIEYLDTAEGFDTRVGNCIRSGNTGGYMMFQDRFTFGSALTLDEATTYDWYTAKRQQSSNPENAEICNISVANGNVAFTAKITPNQTQRGGNENLFGVKIGGNNGGWYGSQGYAIRLSWDFEYYYGNTKLGAKNSAYEAIGSAGDNKTHAYEFGLKKVRIGTEVVGNYLYVKVDGVEKSGFFHRTTTAVIGEKLYWLEDGSCSTFIKGMTIASTRSVEENVAYSIGKAELTMVKGASVRYGGEQNNGIRYTMEALNNWELSTLAKNGLVSSINYGIVILPADYITEAKPLTASNLLVDKVYGEVANTTTEELTEQKSGNKGYSASLINILEANITREFVGVGYVSYVVGENTYYALANFFGGDIENNTRSIYEVAKAAYENAEEDEDVKAAVKAAYLDKCATYTANYYYGEETITKTYVGVIGQTVFAPYVAIEGYVFDSSNASNVTTGVVAQDGTLVLNYYYTAVVA